MKFRILVKLIEQVLGMSHDDDKPRADLYLPDSLLALSIVLVLASICLSIACIFILDIWLIVLAILCLVAGICAFLCWKNQTITVLSNEQFEYKTFLGNKYIYNFKDITALLRNHDSLTLFVNNKKVHIESMAIMSDRLADLIDNQFTEKSEF